ncbi:hypothetical protein L596_005333 [Steinernema carpocapsae]|uniref:Uncharacterized protein n=1 Tax=Steinernema carpocapsae TaxID=34508 RepID=A0A4U8V095_STECR|nr:hypothetical protein L596_005333 [Steinernema carpocapsae]
MFRERNARADKKRTALLMATSRPDVSINIPFPAGVSNPRCNFPTSYANRHSFHSPFREDFVCITLIVICLDVYLSRVLCFF